MHVTLKAVAKYLLGHPIPVLGTQETLANPFLNTFLWEDGPRTPKKFVTHGLDCSRIKKNKIKLGCTSKFLQCLDIKTAFV